MVKRPFEPGDRLAIALDDDFDAAIGQVSRRPLKPLERRRLSRKEAISHALHTT